MVRKGTGFTNINRILQANRGSGLGQAVAGGITGQVQKVQSGVKSAQEQFQEEADKNRLDNDESKQKREQVLGRFDPANYQADMSKFSVSSGLQTGFDANKQKIEQEKAAKAQQAEAAKAQQAQYQSQLTPLQQQMAGTKQYFNQSGISPILGTKVGFKVANPEFTKLQSQVTKLQGQANALNPVVNTDMSAYDKQLADAQTQFETQKQAEMDAYTKSEQQRLLAANMPSDQEIKDFTKYRTGTYTGPAELKDAQTLIGQAQQAESLGGLARSSGGRQELLRQFVGGRDYTQGQRRLDETILGQDQSANLGAAARQTRGAVDEVQGANRLAGNQAEEYRNRAKIFGEETRNMIGEKKNPLSQDLDTRFTQAQEAENARIANLQSMQDLLTGNNQDYAGLDKMTRLGLALDQAQTSGYISDKDVNFLIGGGDKIGLLQRGADLGLDINKLVQERIKNTAAQNLSRTGLASDEDVARLNALDRLSGKQGTDLEFQDSRAKFQAGNLGLDLKSLEDYINRAEDQKAAKDSAYADKIAAQKARYMNQALAYGQGAVGGGLGALGAVGERFLNPTTTLNPLENITNAADIADSVAQVGAGTFGAASQGQNALLEGLTKLNIGGKSLAGTEAGRQLLKAIQLKSKMENELIGSATGAIGDVTSGYRDLAKGTIGTKQLAQIMGIESAKNLASKGIKNVGREIGGALKKATSTKGWKISDEDLKDEIEYNPEDVQKFMDRLKPAAYNYKEEVKDSPLASKNRELGVMAQDLEKSELGKEAVHDTPKGKIVDYDNLEPKMLASLASLNERLKRIEGKK